MNFNVYVEIPTMARRILVLNNYQDAPFADSRMESLTAALFAAAEKLQRDVEWIVVRADRCDFSALESSFEAVVLSGGPADPTPEEFAKGGWVAKEGAFVKKIAETSSKPILGICCGHQILAGAFGGIVGRREDGLKNDRILPVYPILQNPLLAKPLNLQFHHGFEVKNLPPGFEWFAEGKPPASAIQGIRLTGKNVFGLQAHPELGADGPEVMQAFLKLI